MDYSAKSMAVNNTAQGIKKLKTRLGMRDNEKTTPFRPFSQSDPINEDVDYGWGVANVSQHIVNTFI